VTDWTKDPRYGHPEWTLIHDGAASYFVKVQPRKRRRKPRALRFAAVKVGDVLVHRGKSVSAIYPKPPAGVSIANDVEPTVKTTPYASFWIVTHRWFDPCHGWDDPTAGEMVGAMPVNQNGIYHGRPYPWTLRGLAKQGYHYATEEQAGRVTAFIHERRVLIGAVHAGELTREEASLRATPYRELIRDLV